jgi:hypothetical protein
MILRLQLAQLRTLLGRKLIIHSWGLLALILLGTHFPPDGPIDIFQRLTDTEVDSVEDVSSLSGCAFNLTTSVHVVLELLLDLPPFRGLCLFRTWEHVG